MTSTVKEKGKDSEQYSDVADAHEGEYLVCCLGVGLCEQADGEEEVGFGGEHVEVECGWNSEKGFWMNFR